MLRRHALSLVSAALLGLCNPATAQLSSSMTAPLPIPVTDALRTAGIPEDAMSVLVLRGDRTVLAHLADRPLHPASTMKLVTTLVSLERLGPTFRARTELRTTAGCARSRCPVLAEPVKLTESCVPRWSNRSPTLPQISWIEPSGRSFDSTMRRNINSVR